MPHANSSLWGSADVVSSLPAYNVYVSSDSSWTWKSTTDVFVFRRFYSVSYLLPQNKVGMKAGFSVLRSAKLFLRTFFLIPLYHLSATASSKRQNNVDSKSTHWNDADVTLLCVCRDKPVFSREWLTGGYLVLSSNSLTIGIGLVLNSNGPIRCLGW